MSAQSCLVLSSFCAVFNNTTDGPLASVVIFSAEECATSNSLMGTGVDGGFMVSGDVGRVVDLVVLLAD